MKIIIREFTPQCIKYAVIYNKPHNRRHLSTEKCCKNKLVYIQPKTHRCMGSVCIFKYQHDLDNYTIFGRRWYVIKKWVNKDAI